MGILKRIKNMFSASFNQALDDMEDPSAMLDQYVRNMRNDLASVKADTASVMAVAKGIERKIKVTTDDISSLTAFAQAALKDGNENDARAFLTERENKEIELHELEQSYVVAKANVDKMIQMHASLSQDIADAANRKALLKSKIKVTRTQNVINRTAYNCKNTGKNLTEFTRLEEKINAKMDESLAMEAIDVFTSEDSIEDLKAKYSHKQFDSKVEAALLEMKKEAV